MANRKENACLIRDILRIEDGKVSIIRKGSSGPVIRKTHNGTVTVLKVDNRIYRIPSDMAEIVSPAAKGKTYG